MWGRAITKVRSPAEDVLAFFWNTKARSQYKADTIEKAYLEEPNAHNRLEYLVKKVPSPFTNREFYNRCVWKVDKKDDDLSRKMLVSWPEEGHEADSHGRDIYNIAPKVRGRTKGIFKIKSSRFTTTEVEVELVIQIDMGGGTSLPKFLMEFYNAYNLRRVTVAQQYFQQLRGLDDYDEKDGIAVGEALMLKSKVENAAKRKSRAEKYEVSEEYEEEVVHVVVLVQRSNYFLASSFPSFSCASPTWWKIMSV